MILCREGKRRRGETKGREEKVACESGCGGGEGRVEGECRGKCGGERKKERKSVGRGNVGDLCGGEDGRG